LWERDLDSHECRVCKCKESNLIIYKLISINATCSRQTRPRDRIERKAVNAAKGTRIPQGHAHSEPDRNSKKKRNIYTSANANNICEPKSDKYRQCRHKRSGMQRGNEYYKYAIDAKGVFEFDCDCTNAKYNHSKKER
jgi:hypothetical protein